MIIQLDTNILRADFWMRGSDFRTLFESLKRIGARAYISEVVRDEIFALYRRELEKAAFEAKRSNTSWLQLTQQEVPAKWPSEDFSKYERRYRDFFEKQLKDRGINLLDYPKVSHKALVERASSRRKPFNDSGAGYRDALIWESLLQQRRIHEEEMVFISNNSRDFGTAPNLADDLRLEIEEGKSIELYNTLAAFNTAKIIPQLEQLSGLLHEIQDGRHKNFDLGAWIDSKMQEEINRNDDAFAFVGLDYGHGDVWVSKILKHEDVTVDDVRALPSGDLLLSANVDLTMEILVSAKSEDCYRYSDIRDFFGGGDCSGDPMTSVEESGNVAFTLTLKKESFQVDWCAIDEITGVYGVTINPHPRMPT